MKWSDYLVYLWLLLPLGMVILYLLLARKGNQKPSTKAGSDNKDKTDKEVHGSGDHAKASKSAAEKSTPRKVWDGIVSAVVLIVLAVFILLTVNILWAMGSGIRGYFKTKNEALKARATAALARAQTETLYPRAGRGFVTTTVGIPCWFEPARSLHTSTEGKKPVLYVSARNPKQKWVDRMDGKNDAKLAKEMPAGPYYVYALRPKDGEVLFTWHP